MVFDTLFEESINLESFSSSLKRNYQAVTDFYEMSYRNQQEQQESIERFILLRKKIISSYAYTDTQSRSFILILLDFCERFSLYSCIPHISKIISKNGIEVTKRMSAGMKTIIPKPTSNQDLVNRFDDICCLLTEAIDEEEDNDKQSIVTFLNYYDHLVINTNQVCVQQINEKIATAIDEQKYPWISCITDISDNNISDLEALHQSIEDKIDSILERGTHPHIQSEPENLLIETDTNYSREIASVPNRFLSIRQVNVNHANGQLRGRGVNQLATEDEMFEYIKRYGNMHYAKLMSAFENSFPQSFDDSFDLIDWGCGQALATMSFIEKYGNSHINSITLIEPSEIVIRRAALHCRKFAPNVSIYTICKELDEVKAEDFQLSSDVRIHLFSNILDIDDYRVSHLTSVVEKLLSSDDYFVCVSPYINDIKSAKIQSFMDHFSGMPSYRLYHDIENTKQGAFWACNQNFGNKHTIHGNGFGCLDYDRDGCSNKWTRVLKVFSV
ncbi:MAG: hypothetical protein MSK40_09660 [Parabacteroides sp.]|nr:hypothetical protein [Parabacteroides sp.]